MSRIAAEPGNPEGRCSGSETTHRHRYGVDASYWATPGYYEVQEKLRQAFPNLLRRPSKSDETTLAMIPHIYFRTSLC
jgi:hypothetical protein